MTLIPTSGVYSPGSIRSVVNTLRYGQGPLSIAIFGDSTGNNTTDWFPVAMEWLGDQFPAYSVKHVAWSETLDAWDPANAEANVPYTLQTGTAGEAYLMGTWSASCTLTCPDSAGLRITGDLDVRIKCAPTSWTVGAAMCLTSKFGSSGNRSWRFQLGTGALLTFEGTSDGTTLVGVSSSATLTSAGFVDGTPAWVRVTYAASTATITFYTSSDGSTWTQLGTTRTLTAVTSLYASTQAPEIGGRTGGNDGFAGKIYYVEWRSGIGATSGIPKIIVDMNAVPGSHFESVTASGTFYGLLGQTWTVSGSALTVAGAPTLFLFNGSAPSQAVSYSNDGTRGPVQRAIMPPEICFISYGHNEATVADYRSVYKTLADSCISAWPYVGIIACTQNPKLSPVDTNHINGHRIRNAQVVSLAMAQRYGLLDAYSAFELDSRGLAALVSTDGVHPTTTGYALWANVAKALFDPWLHLSTGRGSSSIIGSIGS